MYRLLIVDDEPTIADGIADFLQEECRYELEVHPVYSAMAALTFLESNRVDIVASDIKMPYMNGIELLDKIKKYWECDVIFITGHEDFNSLYAITQYQNVKFILKSDGLESFLKIVEETIDTIEIETRKPLKEENYAQTYADVYRLNMLRSIIKGEFQTQADKSKKEIESVCGDFDLYEPFYLLMGISNHTPDSYFEFITNFYKLQRLSEYYLGRFSSFFQIDYDYHTYIWMIQPTQSTNCSTKILNVLDIFQQNIQEKIGIEIGFVFLEQISSIKSCVRDVLHLIYQSSEIQGLKGKIIAVDNSENDQEHEIILCTLDKSQIEMLKLFLSQNSFDNYINLFHQLTKTLQRVKSKSNPHAREYYAQLSEMLLSHINKYKLIEKVSFIVGISPLSDPLMHDSWKKSVDYLETISVAIFHVQKENDTNELEDLFNKIDAYIRQHIGDALSLTMISDFVHFNPSYLSHIFKEYYQITLSEYIIRQKTYKAGELLVNTDLKMNEIALAIGNPSPSNFGRFFKKNTGLTPHDYRKINRNGE